MRHPKKDRKRRSRTVPYWQAIAAVIVMFLALAEAAFFLYYLNGTPLFQERTEKVRFQNSSLIIEQKWDCLYYITESICCKQHHWLTTRNLTTNETIRYTECIKFEREKGDTDIK